MKPYQRASFYIVAHQDDWQLFMNPEVSRDIADKQCRTVIIHTTAGDAGKPPVYWNSREEASADSLLFMISAEGEVMRHKKELILMDKKLQRYEFNDCPMYCLRLPDGAYEGNGFASYGHQSLEKFRSGELPSLISVDRLNEFHSWQELANLLDSIILHELELCGIEAGPGVSLNFPETDQSLNPADHNDHFNTACLVQSTRAYHTLRKRAFIHYNIRNISSAISGTDLFWKTGMFSIYHQTVYRLCGHSTILEDPSFLTWPLLNSSYREIQ